MGGQQRTPEVKKVGQGWMYGVYRNPSVYLQEHVGAYLQNQKQAVLTLIQTLQVNITFPHETHRMPAGTITSLLVVGGGLELFRVFHFHISSFFFIQ